MPAENPEPNDVDVSQARIVAGVALASAVIELAAQGKVGLHQPVTIGSNRHPRGIFSSELTSLVEAQPGFKQTGAEVSSGQMNDVAGDVITITSSFRIGQVELRFISEEFSPDDESVPTVIYRVAFGINSVNNREKIR